MDEFFSELVSARNVKALANLVANLVVDLYNQRDLLNMDTMVRDATGKLVPVDQQQYTQLTSDIKLYTIAKAGLDKLAASATTPTQADLTMALCGSSDSRPDMFGAGMMLWQQCVERSAMIYQRLMYFADQRQEAELQAWIDAQRESARKKSLQLLNSQPKTPTPPVVQPMSPQSSTGTGDKGGSGVFSGSTGTSTATGGTVLGGIRGSTVTVLPMGSGNALGKEVQNLADY